MSYSTRRPATARTYLVLVVPAAGRPRPLGTVVAPSRDGAQAIARAVHADVSPALLRVLAAGSASADLVVYQADPRDDLGVLAHPAAVVLRGVTV